jgi:hypothetical protein
MNDAGYSQHGVHTLHELRTEETKKFECKNRIQLKRRGIARTSVKWSLGVHCGSSTSTMWMLSNEDWRRHGPRVQKVVSPTGKIC